MDTPISILHQHKKRTSSTNFLSIKKAAEMRNKCPKYIYLLLAMVLTGCAMQAAPTYSLTTQNASNPQINRTKTTTPVQNATSAQPAIIESGTTHTPQTSNTPLPQTIANRENYYVAVDGSSSGDGSMAHPWDLDNALLNSKWVAPGDTLWVREGTYLPVIEPAKFNIKLEGSQDNPIFIRAYPGERVTIDARIEIYGENVVFWGFDIMSSSLDRVAEETGSHPTDITRSGGIGIYAANVTLVNNIVHDGRNGITAEQDATNAIIYGNLCYNNGWTGPDRGHGHGIYIQNETGTKTLIDNIVFNNFGGYSFHAYTENGFLNNINFSGNVAVNDVFLVGGLQPSNDISLVGNYIYNTTVKLGYRSQENTNLVLQNNRIWNPSDTGLQVNWWNKVTMANNTILGGNKKVVTLQYPAEYQSYSWNNNLYQSTLSRPFSVGNFARTWVQWKSKTGFDSGSIFNPDYPSTAQVFVQPNQYETTRSNIIIFNWNQDKTIRVDISEIGLENGDHYTLHNAQNYYEEMINGTYEGGTISIPMTGWTVAAPIGWDKPLYGSTFPSFGVFILTSP